MTQSEPPVKLPFRINDLLGGAHAVISIAVVLVGLVAWTVRQEARISHIEASVNSLEHRVSDIDVHGSRSVVVLTEHLDAIDKREIESAIVLNGRIQIVNDRLNAVENLTRRIDALVSRQEEGLRRFEAVDRAIEQLRRDLDGGRPR